MGFQPINGFPFLILIGKTKQILAYVDAAEALKQVLYWGYSAGGLSAKWNDQTLETSAFCKTMQTVLKEESAKKAPKLGLLVYRGYTTRGYFRGLNHFIMQTSMFRWRCFDKQCKL